MGLGGSGRRQEREERGRHQPQPTPPGVESGRGIVAGILWRSKIAVREIGVGSCHLVCGEQDSPHQEHCVISGCRLEGDDMVICLE